jgi:CRISPR-associated endonuclease Csn1
MKKVLGIDLGTNSIGTCLAVFENDELIEITHAGSRIIPMGEEKTAFEQGQKITKNEERRSKRGSRRLNQRYKLRRGNLIKVFHELSTLPLGYNIRDEYLDNVLLGKTYTDEQIYRLRASAVDQEVSLQEFARILYHLNQRRGYLPNRKERAARSNEENSGYEVFNLNTIIKSVKLTGEKKNKKDEYEVVLQNDIIGLTLNPAFVSMESKELEIEVRKKISKKGEISYSFGLPEPGAWQKKLDAMEKDLQNSGLTPGQFYFKKITESRKVGHDYRIRQNLVLRKRYIAEFNSIWDRQAEFHNLLKDESIKNKIIEAVMPKNSPDKAIWLKRDLKEFVRDYIIYFQRKLKSQKQTISKCRFEPLKRVIPSSHPLCQEFKIWQSINNLKVENENGETEFLTVPQKELLYDSLSQNEQLPKEKVAKLLDTYPEAIRMPEYLSGNSTITLLNKACRKAGLSLEKLAPSQARIELLWHILYSLEDNEDENIVNALCKNFDITCEGAEKLVLVYFEKDWGSLSAKAIKRMLPLMRAGRYFDTSDILLDVKTRITRLIDGEHDEILTSEIRKEFENFNSVEDFNGLPYWAAASLIYGKHTTINDADPFSDYSEIEPLPLHSLKNPVVEQMVNETLHIVKDLWKNGQKPNEIRIELPREMKQNASERAKTYKENLVREKRRKEVAEIIRNDKDFGISIPSKKDVDRYLLWEEAKYRCIYSGKNIPKSALFNGETDIDHIIPRQRFFDDSFSNKVLAFKNANQQKDNKTAFEFMKQRDWERYEQEVKDLFRGRKRNLLLTPEIPKDFIKRQLNDSRFIARKVKEQLERICPGKVFVTSGTVTDYLKNLWGLNEVFKQVLLPRFKRMEQLFDLQLINEVKKSNKSVLQIEGFEKRIDHRHHALDAIVIAVTKQGFIQQLNNLSQIYIKGDLKEKSPRYFKLPHPFFKDMVRQKLESLVVSHKSRKRLLSGSYNVHKKRDENGKLEDVKQLKKTFGIRGSLHDQQPYGLVKQYQKVKTSASFEMIDKIAVDWQKSKVEERLAQHKDDVKKAIASLKKAPLTNLAGEPLVEISVFIDKYVKTYELKNISEKQLKNIANRKLAKELAIHAAKYGGDFVKAFSEDGLIEFNSKRKKAVYKVRVLLNADLKQLKGADDNNDKKFIKEGSNFCMVVYENTEGQRLIENISFYDAVQLATFQQPIVEKKIGYSHFTLHAGELVYVPIPGETRNEINLQNLNEIHHRIYKFVKSSGKQAYFIPHNIATPFNSKNYKIDEFGSQNCTEFVYEDNPRTKISEVCIKLRVDRLGNVKVDVPRVNGIEF